MSILNLGRLELQFDWLVDTRAGQSGELPWRND